MSSTLSVAVHTTDLSLQRSSLPVCSPEPTGKASEAWASRKVGAARVEVTSAGCWCRRFHQWWRREVAFSLGPGIVRGSSNPCCRLVYPWIVRLAVGRPPRQAPIIAGTLPRRGRGARSNQLRVAVRGTNKKPTVALFNAVAVGTLRGIVGDRGATDVQK